MTRPTEVVVMGVAGTGKSTVAERISAELGYEFVEGDDFHPRGNLEKMGRGEPLTDADRLPWLQALADLIAERDAAGTPVVVTCSALTRGYRDLLRSRVEAVFFVHLHAAFDVLMPRMSQRQKHFMPPSLLESQFQTLEPLGPGELGVTVDVGASLDAVVAAATRAVQGIGT